MIERQSLQVDLTRKDFYPDFNVQYMWQRTDPAQFRAYYMLSVGIKAPSIAAANNVPNWLRPNRNNFGREAGCKHSRNNSPAICARNT